jgi:uncharacterized protein (DUF433 family)
METSMALDWSECPRMTIPELIEQFDVTREQVTELLDFVARSLDKAPAYG